MYFYKLKLATLQDDQDIYYIKVMIRQLNWKNMAFAFEHIRVYPVNDSPSPPSYPPSRHYQYSLRQHNVHFHR